MTGVSFPTIILVWGDAGVDQHLADSVLCFLQLQLLHLCLLIEVEKIPCIKVGFGGCHASSGGSGLLHEHLEQIVECRPFLNLFNGRNLTVENKSTAAAGEKLGRSSLTSDLRYSSLFSCDKKKEQDTAQEQTH